MIRSLKLLRMTELVRGPINPSNALTAESAIRHAMLSQANDAYLGPAALNRAWTLMNDERDGARQTRLDAVSGDAGCHNCHSQHGCSTYCPNLLAPASSIAGLKRQTLMNLLPWGPSDD
jgi:succinate dehydrogenase/fumarate reductase-like Fe-S protein